MAAPMSDELHGIKPTENDKNNAVVEEIDCKDNEIKISRQFLELQSKKGCSKAMEELLLLSGKNSKIASKPTQTYKLPPSSVLSQVKQFLPVMADANTKLDRLLQDVPASDVDIENVDNTEGPVIQMDIALGILNDSCSSEDDSDDSDSDDSDYDGDFTEKTETNLKTSKHRHKAPYIEEITDQTDKSTSIPDSDNKKTVNCDDESMSHTDCSSSNENNINPHR